MVLEVPSHGVEQADSSLYGIWSGDGMVLEVPSHGVEQADSSL